MELTESILLRDADKEEADVVENEELVEGVFGSSVGDGDDRKKNLRDQLRRTLSRRDTDVSLWPARRKGKSVDVNEIQHSPGVYVSQSRSSVVFGSVPLLVQLLR